MSTAYTDVLAHIDALETGTSVTALVAALPAWTDQDIKAALRDLHDNGRIHRLRVIGPTRVSYFIFFSLKLITAAEYRQTDIAPALDIEAATAVLERAGWRAEPEVVEVLAPAPAVEVERRVTDRRAPRFGVMDVIDRWKLGYRLSRIIEIVGGTRNRKMTRDDAATVIRMVREHMRGEE